MHQKSLQSSVSLRVLAVVLACSFFAVAAMAQEKAANVAPSAQAGTVAAGGNSAIGKADLSATDAKPGKPAGIPTGTASPLVTKSNDNPGASNGSTDYKTTLNNLEALYGREVQRLEQQNTQAKGLFSGGVNIPLAGGRREKGCVGWRAR